MLTAAAWSAGAANGQLGGADPTSVLPSLPEAAMLGVLTQKHNRGLHMGGLVGYSTFFTGYNPAQGGALRAVSVGRAAGQAVSLSAGLLRGLTTEGSQAHTVLTRAMQTHRFGLAGVFNAVSQEDFMRHRIDAYSNLKHTFPMKNRQQPPMSKRQQNNPKRATKKWNQHVSRTRLNHTTIPKGAKDRLHTMASRRAMGGSMKGSKAWKWLAGVLGGVGYDAKTGKALFEYVDGGDGHHYAQAKAGSKGAAIGGRSMAQLGRMAKMAGWAQIGIMVGDYAIDQIGEAYGAAARTVAQMRDRYGPDAGLSPAYISRAAVTERQRAQAELNQSVLNPRSQLMGNEAAFYHR